MTSEFNTLRKRKEKIKKKQKWEERKKANKKENKEVSKIFVVLQHIYFSKNDMSLYPKKQRER